ncbi:hypothetical protein AAFN46_10450 [Pseudomonas sp. CAU 1711]|uniref:hypothetical protein n=1 Tax=Pseudomonas sp. CAU 1711 TaxID=3140356 RepID=UPI003260EAF1
MDIHIRELTTGAGVRWQVCLDRHGVSFRSEREAREFVAILRSRIGAPHALPRRAAPAIRSPG